MMNIHDEQDLRSRLGTALDEFTPGPFPLDAVIARGRSALIRRRIAAATAAVAVAAAVAAPVLARQITSGHTVVPAPTMARPLANWPPKALTHYHVTVYPPGPGSQPGLIAYGRVDGRAWRVTGTRETISGKPNMCINVILSAGSPFMACEQNSPPEAYEPPLASRHGNPADISSIGLAAPQVVSGTVRADVTYLLVSLSNGQELTLRPAAIFGAKFARYVAFAAPRGAAVTLIRAYSRRDELAYAVPFMAEGLAETVRWIGAGQPARPRPAAYMIGSGELNGARWTIRLYAGPWGTCFSWQGGSDCVPGAPSGLARGHIAQAFEFGLPLGSQTVISHGLVMVTAPSVGYLVFRGSDGSTSRVGVTEAAGAGFAVFMSVHDTKGIGWTAYSAAGTRLGSGRVT
jgi:hypothetical protein